MLIRLLKSTEVFWSGNFFVSEKIRFFVKTNVKEREEIYCTYSITCRRLFDSVESGKFYWDRNNWSKWVLTRQGHGLLLPNYDPKAYQSRTESIGKVAVSFSISDMAGDAENRKSRQYLKKTTDG